MKSSTVQNQSEKEKLLASLAEIEAQEAAALDLQRKCNTAYGAVEAARQRLELCRNRKTEYEEILELDTVNPETFLPSIDQILAHHPRNTWHDCWRVDDPPMIAYLMSQNLRWRIGFFEERYIRPLEAALTQAEEARDAFARANPTLKPDLG